MKYFLPLFGARLRFLVVLVVFVLCPCIHSLVPSEPQQKTSWVVGSCLQLTVRILFFSLLCQFFVYSGCVSFVSVYSLISPLRASTKDFLGCGVMSSTVCFFFFSLFFVSVFKKSLSIKVCLKVGGL